MTWSTVLIALGFAALAALFVSIGFRGQERRLETQAELATEPAILAQAAEAEDESWPAAGLSLEDRRAVAFLASLAALGTYLWILVCAFREHFAWGLAVLFGNALGAILFTILHPRQSLLPLFVMFGGLGVSWAVRFGSVG